MLTSMHCVEQWLSIIFAMPFILIALLPLKLHPRVVVTFKHHLPRGSRENKGIAARQLIGNPCHFGNLF